MIRQREKYVNDQGALTDIGWQAFQQTFTDQEDRIAALEARLAVSLTTQSTQALSGTATTFTGIPSWVNIINFTMRGVSTTGTSPYTIRVGDGAIVSTGYTGAVTNISGATPATSNSTTGCQVVDNTAAGSFFRGNCSIIRVSTVNWVLAGTGAFLGGAETTVFASQITLTGDLDRVQLTTNGGANTFDNGNATVTWQ
jgi:hypothetical protein